MPISSLLIVAGAGASRNLGMNVQPMPLMGDWCSDLVGRLNRSGSLGDALGLTVGMDGEEFEGTIGTFLAWRRALPLVQSLSKLGSSAPYHDPQQAVTDWFRNANSTAQQIEAEILGSLYELFGQEQVSAVSAGMAYGWLLDLIHVTPSTPLAFATTNYDVAIEMGLPEIQRRPYWGQDATLGGGMGLAIHAEGMADLGTPSRVPVMHLHGRVGWYVNEQGEVISTPPQGKYNSYLGQPALLLPEIDKDYTVLPVVMNLWAEFDRALDSASHVLVLGHSLHDAQLVERLQRRVPRGGVAVSVEKDSPREQIEKTRIMELLPGAEVVRVQFGPEDHSVGGEIEEWCR